jgi:hypothetical protein
VPTDPPADLSLVPLGGEARTLAEWLTTFHLVVVVLDPFTYESAWALDAAGRILESYSGADCRPAFLVTGTDDETRQFLGPWTERLLAFADPDREFVKAVGIQRLPALVHLNITGHVEGLAEGWQPDQWRPVLVRLSKLMSWSRPAVPGPGDPAPYEGSPALA